MIHRLGILAVLAAQLSSASIAWAHADMNQSAPQDGEVVAQGLSEITLTFSEPLRITVVTVAKNGSKEAVGLKSKLPPSFVKKATLPVDPLAEGAYEVNWRGVSNDGHIMNGYFSFSVKKPGT